MFTEELESAQTVTVRGTDNLNGTVYTVILDSDPITLAMWILPDVSLKPGLTTKGGFYVSRIEEPMRIQLNLHGCLSMHLDGRCDDHVVSDSTEGGARWSDSSWCLPHPNGSDGDGDGFADNL